MMLPAPPATPETAKFAAAAREGRFLIRRCTACAKPHWYPRAICPFCGGETRWEEATGRGELSAFTTLVRADPPYSLAYEIGRASCRDRMCSAVYISIFAASIKKKKNQN